MTCIITISTPDSIYMGADSCFYFWDEVMQAQTSKIIALPGMLVGATGTIRALQVMKYGSFTSFKQWREAATSFLTEEQYLVTSFIPELRNCLEEEGQLRNREGVNQVKSTFIVALNGKSFMLESNFQVVEVSRDYCCIGSGASYANGALYSIFSPEEMGFRPLSKRKILDSILTGLSAASYHSPSVSPPFYIYSLTKGKIVQEH